MYTQYPHARAWNDKTVPNGAVGVAQSGPCVLVCPMCPRNIWWEANDDMVWKVDPTK